MLFSIIVPIYKVEKYLRQCIESVLNQSFSDFELILVDDGSPDNCGKIIDEYAIRDSRVVTIHKVNGGVTSARKAALNLACGDFIIPLDGDDWIAENTLEQLSEAIRCYDSDIVCFGFCKTDGNTINNFPIAKSTLHYSKLDIQQNILGNLLYGNRTTLITQNVWGKAFRTSLYAKFQMAMDERITMGEDGVIVYLTTCAAASICFLSDCLYYYRTVADSATNKKQKQIPWDGALLRIEHLKQHLPLDQYNMRQQLGCYVSHAIFNVILTQLNNRPYREVKAEALEKLSDTELMEWIFCADYAGSIPEKLAQFALRCRWIWLIKLYTCLMQ